MGFDVVVAGAGPVGLLLASEIQAAGARVLVLERAESAEQPIKEGEMGARSLNAPSVLALHRRGLLPSVRESALFWFDPAAEVPKPVEGEPPPFAGHFAGIPLRADRLDPADPDLGFHVGSTVLGGGAVTLAGLERTLTAHAEKLGVEIRRGKAVTAVEADDSGVTVRAGDDTVRAGWLVGCDGGRSTVRRLAGFEFPGCGAEFLSRQALVDMTEPELLAPGGLHNTETGSYILGGWEKRLRPTRLVLIEPVERAEPPEDRDTPVTATELQDAIRRLTGIDTEITAIHAASRYSDTTRQASTYRRGRVLLAGDAAHVHSPAGGQGLNLGLGDAMNLGWKLAATVLGWAPEGLLDTYTAERHALGAWVQDWTKAQAAIGRRDARSQALREVVADLLESTHGTTYVMKKISGAGHHYELSDEHPAIGRPAPEIALVDGATVGEHSHSARFLLLHRAGYPIAPEVVTGWAGRLTVLPTDSPGMTAEAMLVRPDGYTAWATDDVLTADTLTTWLGTPERPTGPTPGATSGHGG